MGKNQLIHGNEFHLLKQAEINDLLGISEPCETRVTDECFS